MFLPYDKQICLFSHCFHLKLNTCQQPPDSLDVQNTKFFVWRCIFLIFCLLQLIEGLCQFMWYFNTPPRRSPTLRHNDCFLALPLDVVQQVISINNIINMVVYLLLTYAAVFFAPHLMWHWLLYYSAFLVCRFSRALLRRVTSNLSGSRFKSTLSVISVLVEISFVRFCKAKFEEVLLRMSD